MERRGGGEAPEGEKDLEPGLVLRLSNEGSEEAKVIPDNRNNTTKNQKMWQEFRELYN